MLSIKNLNVSVNNIPLLFDLTLTILPGSVHALMGPNGSGKSSFAYTLMGHPEYTVDSGSIVWNGVAMEQLSIYQRALQGIFLSFQTPPEIPGVQVYSFLKELFSLKHCSSLATEQFQLRIHEYCQILQLDHSFLYRGMNEGFSGGEKKQLELLQILVLQPQLIILDEIDSGLDIDALRSVARVIEYVRAKNCTLSVIVITHYQRLLHTLIPDYVHILHKGSIVRSGDMQLVYELEREGYGVYQ